MNGRNRIGATLLLACAFFATHATAQRVVEVYPLGLYPDDVLNVQLALDKVGAAGEDAVIILKSRTLRGKPMHFDFGTAADPTDRGTVEPAAYQSGAIEFRGELTRDAHTVILGGNTPIHFDRRDEITIRNIEFRNSFRFAIRIRESLGTIVEGNRIVDLEGTEIEGRVSRPIGIGPSVAFNYGEITGPVLVRNNFIDGATGWFVQGIAVNVTDGLVQVLENTVSGVNVGVQLSYYTGKVVVSGNTLNVSVPRPNFFAAGVEISPGNSPASAATITHNEITAADTLSVGEAFGITAATYDRGGHFRDSMINDNTLRLVNAIDGIDCVIFNQDEDFHCHGNEISRNMISGTSDIGIYLGQLSGTGRLFNNNVEDNLLGKITGAFAHIYLDAATHNNVVSAGPDDVVVDLGKNNDVVVTFGHGLR